MRLTCGSRRHDPLGTIATIFSRKDRLDLSPKDGVAQQAFLTPSGGAFPFVIRGPIEFEDLA